MKSVRLSLMMLISVLAACSSDPPPSTPTTTTAIDSFGANPGPTPVNVGAQFSWTVLGQNLRCQLDVEGNGGDKIGNNDLCNGFNEYRPTAKSS